MKFKFIQVYTLLQISLSVALISLLIHFDYPLYHALGIGMIFGGIWLITKLKHTAIGMYIGATDKNLQFMIKSPFIMKDDDEDDEDPIGNDFVISGKSGEA